MGAWETHCPRKRLRVQRGPGMSWPQLLGPLSLAHVSTRETRLLRSQGCLSLGVRPQERIRSQVMGVFRKDNLVQPPASDEWHLPL